MPFLPLKRSFLLNILMSIELLFKELILNKNTFEEVWYVCETRHSSPRV
jgi:NADH:ubiquinone oxidoreductase subunit K